MSDIFKEKLGFSDEAVPCSLSLFCSGSGSPFTFFLFSIFFDGELCGGLGPTGVYISGALSLSLSDWYRRSLLHYKQHPLLVNSRSSKIMPFLGRPFHFGV